MISCVITLIGSIILLNFLREILHTLWIIYFAKPLNLETLYGKNSYVIITGGSKGIGFGFAVEFAKRNFNLVLISRNQEDLMNAKEKIKSVNPHVSVITRSFDFNTLGKGGVDHDLWTLLDLDDKLDYSVLINNVGTSFLSPLEDLDEEQVKRVITVNCTSQALMSNMMAKKFAQRTQTSCVVHVSSIANNFPFPYVDLYGATKAFNQHLALSMANDKNIDHYIYSPGYVDTDLIKKLKHNKKVSVKLCLENAMKFVGRGRVEFRGHISHEVMHLMLKLTPGWLLKWKINQVKKKYIDKKQKEKQE